MERAAAVAAEGGGMTSEGKGVERIAFPCKDSICLTLRASVQSIRLPVRMMHPSIPSIIGLNLSSFRFFFLLFFLPPDFLGQNVFSPSVLADTLPTATLRVCSTRRAIISERAIGKPIFVFFLPLIDFK